MNKQSADKIAEVGNTRLLQRLPNMSDAEIQETIDVSIIIRDKINSYKDKDDGIPNMIANINGTISLLQAELNRRTIKCI